MIEWNYSTDGKECRGGWLSDGRNSYWNPLTDDGDALRLAIQIGLDSERILCLYLGNNTAEFNFDAGHPTEQIIIVEHDGDPCAATRRAIVRAAAALA